LQFHFWVTNNLILFVIRGRKIRASFSHWKSDCLIGNTLIQSKDIIWTWTLTVSLLGALVSYNELIWGNQQKRNSWPSVTMLMQGPIFIVMLSVIVLNVVMLNVVMLGVLAPQFALIFTVLSFSVLTFQTNKLEYLSIFFIRVWYFVTKFGAYMRRLP
jgi:hypothetical protein